MGIFDWVPTVPEVLTSAACLISGHEYENGVCTVCGKKNPK